FDGASPAPFDDIAFRPDSGALAAVRRRSDVDSIYAWTLREGASAFEPRASSPTLWWSRGDASWSLRRSTRCVLTIVGPGMEQQDCTPRATLIDSRGDEVRALYDGIFTEGDFASAFAPERDQIALCTPQTVRVQRVPSGALLHEVPATKGCTSPAIAKGGGAPAFFGP